MKAMCSYCHRRAVEHGGDVCDLCVDLLIDAAKVEEEAREMRKLDDQLRKRP